MAATSAWQRFGPWRRRRPFWGGLLLLLAGLALFFSANLTLADMKVHFGQEGYLSYLLPAVLLLCGALIWATPAQRLFYGVIGLITALYSLIGLNLGGFGLGMLLGIVGGALALAWTPARPTAPEPPPPATPAVGPAAGPEAPPFAPPGDDGPPTDILPGFDQHRGTHRKLFVLLLVPLLLTAAWLGSGGTTPAYADDCPKGLPSRSAAVSPQRSSPATPTRRPSRATTPSPAPAPRTTAPAIPSSTAGTTSSRASATCSAAAGRPHRRPAPRRRRPDRHGPPRPPRSPARAGPRRRRRPRRGRTSRASARGSSGRPPRETSRSCPGRAACSRATR